MWWQPHETAYPTLAKLAKKYLSPYTSSCASEGCLASMACSINEEKFVEAK